MMMKYTGYLKQSIDKMFSIALVTDQSIKERESQSIKMDNKVQCINMGLDHIDAKMVQSILEDGSKALDVVKENAFIMMDLSILVNGLTIKNMVMAIMFIKIVINTITNMWAILLMINNKEKDKWSIITIPSKEVSIKDLSKEEAI